MEVKRHLTRGGDRLFSDETALHIRMLHHNANWQGVDIADVKAQYGIVSEQGVSGYALWQKFCPDKSHMVVYQILNGVTYQDAGGLIGVVKPNVKPSKPANRRVPKLPKEKHGDVLALKQSGMKNGDIAKQYGVTAGYITHILAKVSTNE